MRLGAPLLVALTVSCATPVSADRSLAGRWGGPHVGLDQRLANGRLTYDCATGTIDQPLIAAADGTFRATGTHTPGHGGPDRVGDIPRSFAARYSGSVHGDTLTLVVAVDGIAARIGPYMLRRDAPPNLLRCL